MYCETCSTQELPLELLTGMCAICTRYANTASMWDSSFKRYGVDVHKTIHEYAQDLEAHKIKSDWEPYSNVVLDVSDEESPD